LILFNGDADMETNPYINVTGSVATFNAEERSFVTTPNQYSALTHSLMPFPIHAHFADSESKRWGTDGPKVAVGSLITFGGSLQQVVRDHTVDRIFQHAQVEVVNIAYVGNRGGNFAEPPPRMF
jgi:hypothetical protein